MDPLNHVFQQFQSGQYKPGSPPQDPNQGAFAPPQSPQPSEMPPPTQMVPPTAQDMSAPPSPIESPEAKMIVGALINRMKGITEMQEALLGIHDSQAPQGPGL